ncbi:uncharacterized protein [Ptychodera flava]|uniref:uncharacterized protein n=1 Tax=Ptychodera flava TaxID=63121 RepID=UPI00396A8541
MVVQGKETKVKVEMVNTGSVSRLRIQGGPQDVMTVHKEVNVLLERIHDEERHESEAKLLAKTVKWLFLNENEELEEYDLLTTGIIEKAYQEDKTGSVLFNIEGGRYKIDFKQMKESVPDDPTLGVVEVRRELKEGGFSLPSSWTNMLPGQQVERVVLDPKSKEYDTVAKHFRQTLQSRPLQTIHQFAKGQECGTITVYPHSSPHHKPLA